MRLMPRKGTPKQALVTVSLPSTMKGSLSGECLDRLNTS